MLANLRTNARPWLLGAFLAFAGVIIARGVAPQFAERVRAAIAFAGQLVALSGLVVIIFGIRRRLQRDEGSANAP